jgi:hypothetical protein
MKKTYLRKQSNISAIVLLGGKLDKTLYDRCLKSISWCNEIVSVDTTLVNGDFSDWRNFGAKTAKGEWLLYVDTDEEVTETLKNEILQSVRKKNAENFSFAIPRRNIFLGKEMKHGGWYPDRVLRLIHKKNLVSWEGKLHEQPSVIGGIYNLKNPLVHTSHRSLYEMTDKTNRWSQIEADLMFDGKHPPMNLPRFISAGFREFWYRAVEKSGFRDGSEGIIEVIYQTYSRLISYIKLWEKQEVSKHTDNKHL